MSLDAGRGRHCPEEGDEAGGQGRADDPAEWRVLQGYAGLRLG